MSRFSYLRTFAFVSLILLLLPLSASSAFPTITIPHPTFTLVPIAEKIQATADATLSGGNPSNNYGSSDNLVTGQLKFRMPTYPYSIISFHFRTVASFDISNKIPPGSDVSDAKLCFTVSAPPRSGVTVNVYALKKSFKENQVTWIQRETNKNWSSYGGDYFPSVIASTSIGSSVHQGTKICFDITSYVRNLVQNARTDYGFLLKHSGDINDTVSFFSKEGTTNSDWKPHIEIFYKSSYIDLRSSHSKVNVTQGSSADVQLSVGGTYNGRATLSYEWIGGSPSGVTVSFSRSEDKAPFASIMTLRASSDASPGSYKLRVESSNSHGEYSLRDHVDITVNVLNAAEPDFSISLNPEEISVSQGDMGTFTIVVTPLNGFSSSITFTPTGIPPASTYQFVSSGSNLYLKIQTSSSTPPGSYKIVLLGSGGGKSHSATANLTVISAATATQTQTATGPQARLLISVNPTFLSIQRGSKADLTVSVNGYNGFSSPVVLGASGLPTGVQISASANNVPPNFTSIITISVSGNAPLGAHHITILATGGGQTRSSTITLNITESSSTQSSTTSPTSATSSSTTTTTTTATTHTTATTTKPFDFSISIAPASLTINPGSSGSVAVTVKKISGTGGTVQLSVSGLPPDAKASFNPPSLAEGTSSLIITAGSSTGTFTVVVTGTSGSLRKSSTFQLTISGAKEESRCIIATAAFGSELDPHVSYLRNFRDHLVMSTYAGSRFISAFNSFYYSWSPQVAGIIRKNGALASLTRLTIAPLLAILEAGSSLYKMLLPLGGEASIVFTGVISSFLLGLIYLSPLLILSKWNRVGNALKNKKVLAIVLSVTGASLIALGISIYFMIDSLALASSALLVLGMISLAPLIATHVISKASLILKHYTNS